MKRLAAGLLTLLLLTGSSLAQQLDLDILPDKPPAKKPASKSPSSAIPPSIMDSASPEEALPSMEPGSGKPLSITISKTLYLPPAMYGQWSVVGNLLEANADFFNPTVNDIWVLQREGDQVVVENPANGAKAAINVDRVDGATAVFHRTVPAGRNKIYLENPTITVTGDNLVGHSVNRVRYMKDGKVTREYYAVYRLQAQRISGARVQFRPESTAGGPDIEIEDVQRQMGK